MRKLILSSNLCPGDILTMTAAVESLHLTYPGEYETDVRTTCKEIWENNPHITELLPREGVDAIEMHYETIHECNQRNVTFLGGYTAFLGKTLGRPLELKVNRPYLYLTDDEKKWADQVTQHFTNGRKQPFWLLNAGVKRDYTIKGWPLEHYQKVVDDTIGQIQWVQIGAREHNHPHIERTVDLRGKTTHRQLMRLAWHAVGGLGPVTYLQHLMAAHEKPYICLLGGREPVAWVQYPLQHTLHTIGQLSCCRNAACFRARVEPLNDGDEKNKSLCDMPIVGLQRTAAKCMAMIRPEEVVQIVRRLACG